MRLPRQEKIGCSRSHCDHCQTELTLLDLFPIFSFLIHKGACRYCAVPLSSMYLWIECTGGIIFLSIFLHYNDDPFLFMIYGLLYIVLLLMTAFDYLYFILPDWLQALLFFLFFTLHLYSPTLSWKNAFFGLSIIFSIGILASFIISDGIGGGDLKLMASLGFAMGLKNASFILFLSSGLGICFFGWQSLFHNRNLKQGIPFGPFLIFSFFLINEGPFLFAFLLNRK